MWALGAVLVLGIISQLSRPTGSTSEVAAGAPVASTSYSAVTEQPVEPSIMADEAPPPAAASSEPIPATQSQTGKYDNYPEVEKAFIYEVHSTIAKYNAAETDLQRSKVMRDRNAELLNLLGGYEVRDWVGVIDTVGANGEGKAYVSVELFPGIQVKTWNNALSDTGDSTLIPDSDPMYDALLGVTPGDEVIFSGTLFADPNETLRTTNMTETFSVRSPEFLMQFWAISTP